MAIELKTAAGAPRGRYFFCSLQRQAAALAAHVRRLSLALTCVLAASAATQSLAAPPALAHGDYHACSLDSAGAMSCWGYNATGQLGTGNTINSTVPKGVPGLASGVRAVAAGLIHTCAALNSGAVQCWGYNNTGQLGDGTQINRSSPTFVVSLPASITALAAGFVHTCALTNLGGVKCWGSNAYGQLGNGTGADSNVPVDVSGLSSGVIAIAAGGQHTCAVIADRSVRCWGDNFQGQLGSGNNNGSLTPVTVSGLANAASLAAGGFHTCAVTTASTVKCWGFNSFLQLGDGTNVSRSLPGDVPGLGNDIAAVAAGRNHSCALTTTGGMKCWGDNDFGQLGDGTSIDRGAPVNVIGLSSGVVAMAAADVHTGAVTSDGGVVSWGGNLGGQLGEGSFATRPLPQQVLGVGGSGYLDLSPENGLSPPSSRVPVFGALATGDINLSSTATVNTTLNFRSGDVNSTGSIYVFVLAPVNRVTGVAAPSDPKLLGTKVSTQDGLACVLAQINAQGQLTAASAGSLQAYFTGVLNSQSASVAVLNNISSAILQGAVVFVGYGPNSSTMINTGLNKPVATVPGTQSCQPQAPQTGWWGKASESGRGFSIEVSGTTLVMSGYIYDNSGRPVWFISAGATSQDGSFYNGSMDGYTGGQTLTGPYRRQTGPSSMGQVTLAFSDARNGVMLWPGGSMSIERLDTLVPPTSLPIPSFVPETGIWLNTADGGRGFFMEFKNNFAAIIGYMFDDAGTPIWYLANQNMAGPQTFQGNWAQYQDGQTITGGYRAPRIVNSNVGPITVQFHTRTTATMTLPGGSQVQLARFRF